MNRFEGKVALITGGTKGIGYAIAERLGLEGASIAICSRKRKNVEAARAQLLAKGIKNVLAIPCHVGTTEARTELVKEVVKAYGRIDVFVSNVACNPVAGPILEATDERGWDKVFDLNVKSHFFLAQSIVPHMPTGGDSNIIFVSSYAGYHPNVNIGVYSVSKTALLGLTKVLADNLGPRGIRVNCLAPGVIKTKFSTALWENSDSTNHLGRYGTPEECAGTAAFLASTDASYITGETIVVSGGVHCRL